MEKNTEMYLRDAAGALATIRQEERRIQALVNRARETGASWTEVGRYLDLSKQTAYARYGKATPKPSKISDADVAGTSETPSIFSDADAPAPQETSIPGITVGPPHVAAWPKATAAQEVDDPIHQGITDTSGTVIDWTGRRQFKNAKKCPFCAATNHYDRRAGHWWIYPDCTLTDGDYTNHDKEATK